MQNYYYMDEFMVISDGVIFSGGTDKAYRSNTFPGICVLRDGRWVCTFRSAEKKNSLAGQRTAVCWSRDEGKSWSRPMYPFREIEADGKKGTFRTGYITEAERGILLAVLCWVEKKEPEQPFYNEETEGLLDTRICISRSLDNGESWSVPQLVGGFPFETVPVPITGPLLRLGSTVLALQFEVNKPYWEVDEWQHKSVIMYSADGGLTWPVCDVVTADPDKRMFYWDQRPAVMRDGSILDLFWVYDKTHAAYRTIHSRRSGIGNNTHCWQELNDTGIHGQPAQPVDMGNGRVAMVYIDRTEVPEIRLAISRDNGRSWHPCKDVLYRGKSVGNPGKTSMDMNEAWSDMAAFHVGLPASVSLGNGEILVVFYAGASTDETGIHWARVALSECEQ